MKLTRAMAWAAATDAANQMAREAGRMAWSKADYDEAVQVFGKLWKEESEPAGAKPAEPTAKEKRLARIEARRDKAEADAKVR